jgi:hypothetical protein
MLIQEVITVLQTLIIGKMSIEVERVFKKLIKKIPQEQKNKEFYLLCFGLAFYNKEKYKGYKVFNIESERDEVTIISKDDFVRMFTEDIEEANVVN